MPSARVKLFFPFVPVRNEPLPGPRHVAALAPFERSSCSIPRPIIRLRCGSILSTSTREARQCLQSSSCATSSCSGALPQRLAKEISHERRGLGHSFAGAASAVPGVFLGWLALTPISPLILRSKPTLIIDAEIDHGERMELFVNEVYTSRGRRRSRRAGDKPISLKLCRMRSRRCAWIRPTSLWRRCASTV